MNEPLPGAEIMADPALIERIARALHENYRINQQDRKPIDHPSMRPWETLDEGLRNSNRGLARDIPRKLGMIDCSLVEGPGDPGFALTPAELEELAYHEHDRWNQERLAAGWTYAEVRDDADKKHDCLKPYSQLTEEIKQYDREAVRDCLAALKRVGLGVRRNGLPRVFVARDFTTPDLATYIEFAVDRSRETIDWDVPGVTDDTPLGEIFKDSLRHRILSAQRVLASVDRENGNVAFEIGHALGQGGQVALFHSERVKPPKWISRSPFESYGVPRIRSADDLIRRATQVDPVGDLPRAATPPPGDRVLVLAPRQGVGADAARFLRERLGDSAQFEQEPEWNWAEAPLKLSGVGHVVFIYERPPTGRRDGLANTVHAAIAGYLLAQGERRLTLVQHATVNRRLVDCGGKIREWSGLGDLEGFARELVEGTTS